MKWNEMDEMEWDELEWSEMKMKWSGMEMKWSENGKEWEIFFLENIVSGVPDFHSTFSV